MRKSKNKKGAVAPIHIGALTYFCSDAITVKATFNSTFTITETQMRIWKFPILDL